MSNVPRVAVIGAGPAGLMAAEALTERGMRVDIYDAMPSFGRKFLMAGKSGLNITHAENQSAFLARYNCDDQRLQSAIDHFGAEEIQTWMHGLGIGAHTGPTGRIFPSMMKASPLLRAWLMRLSDKGAVFHMKSRWTGWSDAGALVFETPDGLKHAQPDATVLALGGASWRRLGSDGVWASTLKAKGIDLAPFGASNCGFLVNWSDHMKSTQAGQPVKASALCVATPDGPKTTRSEFVITERGVESGGIYMLSATLRGELERNDEVVLHIDLCPDVSVGVLAERLSKPRGKQSLSNHLRKAAHLAGVKLALVYEFVDRETLKQPVKLAAAVKNIPIPITGSVPIDEAISTSGGVDWSMLDENFMLKGLPGVFCAGEMLDWDAPTGGYLITACMATGKAAGEGVTNWLSKK